MIPRGFTRCDECEGKGERISGWSLTRRAEATRPCPTCSGSGLVPTEKLREDAAVAIIEAFNADASFAAQADAVLRKVAEHIGEGR